MTETAIEVSQGRRSLIVTMSEKYSIEASKLLNVLKATVFPDGGKNVSDEQCMAFMVVANQYELNPFTREIYAFPGRSGGIVPIISIDGWVSLINRRRELNGIQFQDHKNSNGGLVAITCRIFRTDRRNPIEVTEYMDECKRDTDPWRKWPARMLRHKALIQCARYAFGLSGAYDEDEGERIRETIDATETGPRHALPDANLREAIGGVQRKSDANGETVSATQNGGDFSLSPAPAANGNYISEKQLKRFMGICHDSGWSEQQIKDLLQEKWHIESRVQIPKTQYDEICSFFEAQGAAKAS